MRHFSNRPWRLLFVAISCLGAVFGAQRSGAEASDNCDTVPAVLMIGVRGSGEGQNSGQPMLEGFGIETSVIGAQVLTRLRQAGISIEAHGLEYPADGTWQWISDIVTPGLSYVDSHRLGVDALLDKLMQYSDCSTEPRYLLMGFSQGAHVIRTTLAENDASHGHQLDDKISGIGLLADPRFRGLRDPGITAGSWFFGRGIPVLAGDEIFPNRYEDELYQLCNFGDLVCDGFGFSMHADYPYDQLRAMGDWLAEQTLLDLGYFSPFVGSIVIWEEDGVTSWLVSEQGYRHWIPDAQTWHCLVNAGAEVHHLGSQTLDRIPDAWGVHASCPG